MHATCERCGKKELEWTIRQASFDIGQIHLWKLKLCQSCTEAVQEALLAALKLKIEVVEIGR